MAKIINKYVWLMNTVRKAGERGITLEEIKEEWDRKDNQHLSEGLELLERTFHKWRKAIREQFHVEIECRRKGGYHYFIANPEVLQGRDLSNWLIDTIGVSQLLMNNITLKDRILLEDVPSGLHFLPDVLDAMKGNHVIALTYQGFWHDDPIATDVHPYCVKLFKQRWYMIAYSVRRQAIRTYALDRIINVERQAATFEVPANFSPEVFFKNSYGVMMGSEQPCNIKIRVNAFEANYLRSLPLHHSQHEITRNTDFSVFTYHLCPEFDFRMELLSKGNDVEVLEPLSLRNVIADVARKMNELYNC